MKQQQETEAIRALQRAIARSKAQISDSNWTKYTLAADHDGRPVDINSQLAVRFCVFGGLIRELWPVIDCHRLKMASRLMHQAAAQMDGCPERTIFEFNDDAATKLADIHRLLSLAQDILERQSNIALTDQRLRNAA